jgi:cytochrome c
MKKSLFLLGCLALVWASCHSPEERAAMKASADSAAKAGTTVSAPQEHEAAPEATAPAKTDTAAKEIAPKTDAPVVVATDIKPPAKKAAALPGEGLVKKSDCLACHSVAQKIVGPAYKNVAAKYAATDENIGMLANKIIAGGSGVWGAVPMSPHPAISKADAKDMVKYILSLKK